MCIYISVGQILISHLFIRVQQYDREAVAGGSKGERFVRSYHEVIRSIHEEGQWQET